LQSYRRDLEDASDFLKGRLSDADSTALRHYLNDLAERGFAPSSQARRLSALKQFFKFSTAKVCAATIPPAFWTVRESAPPCRK
jgi:integrase/recombinase XerD